jgi:hypothetical protein
MFYRALLGVMAGAVSLLCNACAQQTMAPAVPTTRVAAPCPGNFDLSTKVYLLVPGFSPVDFGSCRSAQECANKGFQGPQSNGQPSPTYLNPILDAYNLAPSYFKNMLCSLNAIYVDPPDTSDPNKSQAWGMRERATAGLPTHIGISQNIFDSLSKAGAPYAYYENVVTDWLLTPLSPWLNLQQAAAANPNPWIANVSYAASPDPASNDPIAIAILGILAHEMGHILWWEYDVGKYPDPNNPPPQPTKLPLFYTFSWNNKKYPIGYHVFGREDQENPAINPPGLRKLRYEVQYSGPSYTPASHDLYRIYGYKADGTPTANGGEWASLFSTVSVDEDFVETFKLYVLTSGNCFNLTPLTALRIQVPNYGGSATSIDIINNNLCKNTSALYKKEQWMAGFLTNLPPVVSPH